MKTLLIPANVESILQEAVHAELYASHLYKHIANQLQRLGYFGAAKYFREEYSQEAGHYQSLADYLNDVGSVAEIPELDACEESVESLQDAVKLAYETEVDLMQKYSRWYQASDPVTQQRLLSFIEIQRESAGELADLLARIQLAGDDACGLLLIDQEISK